MNEFFMNVPLCASLYLFCVILLGFSIVLRRVGKYLTVLALLVYVADVSALLIFGFSLYKCAITCGMLVILVLASLGRGDSHEL